MVELLPVLRIAVRTGPREDSSDAGGVPTLRCTSVTPLSCASGRYQPAGMAIWHNMVMARRQTLIQLDDARLAALDERAAASGRSRSDLVREAIDLLLGTGDAAAIDAAIVEGYARAPAPERDPWAFEGALAAIKAEPW